MIVKHGLRVVMSNHYIVVLRFSKEELLNRRYQCRDKRDKGQGHNWVDVSVCDVTHNIFLRAISTDGYILKM